MSNQPELKYAVDHDEVFYQDEVRRIREVYKQRKVGGNSAGLTPMDLRGRCAIHEREELLVRVFRKQGLSTLAGLKILDVGCGAGAMLGRLFDYGAEPENCFGVDIIEERLHFAKHLRPNINFILASGAQLPFPDAIFDFVFQFLLFTSVLDPDIKCTIAAEILRTLRRGGRLIWYDFAYNNPQNPDVKGIGRREIRKLLPGCRLDFWRLTLAPPVGRAAVRISPLLYRVLSQVPLLRTHYLCVAEKL
jgi:SAM-dependent methyltransferase